VLFRSVRDLKSAQPLVDAFGDRVVPIEVDLSKEDTIKAAATKASDVDLVINNAGVLKTANALADDAIDSLRYELDINLFGLIRVAQAFAPVLKANGGGAFVQLNSIVSVKAFPDIATYNASKAAAYSITQSLRHTLGEQGTQVYSVHPGPIATDMARDAGMEDMGEPTNVVSDALLEAFKTGEFHIWPDTFARQIGSEYATFAANIVEADLSESLEA